VSAPPQYSGSQTLTTCKWQALSFQETGHVMIGSETLMSRDVHIPPVSHDSLTRCRASSHPASLGRPGYLKRTRNDWQHGYVTIGQVRLSWTIVTCGMDDPGCLLGKPRHQFLECQVELRKLRLQHWQRMVDALIVSLLGPRNAIATPAIPGRRGTGQMGAGALTAGGARSPRR
jgi:hypothetical protein